LGKALKELIRKTKAEVRFHSLMANGYSGLNPNPNQNHLKMTAQMAAIYVQVEIKTANVHLFSPLILKYKFF
jgi:hypothetical protein